MTVHATEKLQTKPRFTEKILDFLSPKSNENFKTVQLQQLSNFQFDQSKIQELPTISFQPSRAKLVIVNDPRLTQFSLNDAVGYALQRHPQISQGISVLAGQNASIDNAKSYYFPQISGGVSTGDLTSAQRGRQILSLNATQMVYDFGKIKSSVTTEQAKLELEQANLLVNIEEVSADVAIVIFNIIRYQKSTEISRQQVDGIAKILNIAKLRAQAGISSQADPIQAQSFLESAQSTLIAQQSLLNQYQQRLHTLLGFDATHNQWLIPDDFIQHSNIYQEPQFNTIPKMIVAQAEIEIAKSQKKQTDLSRYPTLSVRGSVSQALNGVNPSNNKDNGFDSAIMFEANSDFYQGGGASARSRAASYAEEAAKSKLNSVYLQVLDQTKMTRESIENKQKQMMVLSSRQGTTIRTRELYQEQYKLGTRTVLDLLNAEMAIHAAVEELENARYDIYVSLAQYIAVTGQSRQTYGLQNSSIQGFEVQP